MLLKEKTVTGWFIASFFSVCVCRDVQLQEDNGMYWKLKGQETLGATMAFKHREGVAKNVVFFLGDGMGIPSVTAMRIYKGQRAGKSGEEEELAFDRFPFVSLAKTYALDRQNPDSANTATAYFCGVKANFQTIGVDGRVKMGDCEASLNKATHVDSLLKWAQDEGKWTGFVTSTRVTHATPAGLYAHVANRNWESSTPDGRCKDIAYQLVRNSPGKDIRVILGGGLREFLPSNVTDPNGEPGARKDSLNLLDEWQSSKTSQNRKAAFVHDFESFSGVDPTQVDYLLGLFNSSHLPYVTDRKNYKKIPTLVELTTMAIKMLQRSPNGFFLAVEGGLIDVAHHECLAKKSLEEGVEFDAAVQAALNMTNRDDTLIVVTADHSHTFTVGGEYQKRGTNILGIGGVSDVDNLTLTVLNYANGPGYRSERKKNVTEAETTDVNYKQEAAVPLQSETHGAEDVAVYADGPMAHLLHGVHDQSYIPYAIGYASCMGPNKDHCSSASSLVQTYQTILMTLFSICIFVYSSDKK